LFPVGPKRLEPPDTQAPWGKARPMTPGPERSPRTAPAAAFRTLTFCGFALAGVLTAFVAFSLRVGDVLRAVFHATLLLATVYLINRNMDNLAEAEGRTAEGRTAEGRTEVRAGKDTPREQSPGPGSETGAP